MMIGASFRFAVHVGTMTPCGRNEGSPLDSNTPHGNSLLYVLSPIIDLKCVLLANILALRHLRMIRCLSPFVASHDRGHRVLLALSNKYTLPLLCHHIWEY